MESFVSEEAVRLADRQRQLGWPGSGGGAPTQASRPPPRWWPWTSGGKTRGSLLPSWVSLMEEPGQMVRNIFLPTPNINKQRLLTTDEQPSLSPGPRPQTHCRGASSQASVLGSQRAGGWSQHHQCAMRSMDSGSRISLWRRTQRKMTRTQKARAYETGRRLLVYTQQRDWPNLNLKSLGEILVPIRLPSVFKQTYQIPHLRLPPAPSSGVTRGPALCSDGSHLAVT